MKNLFLLIVFLFLLVVVKNASAQDYALNFDGDDLVTIDAATWRDTGYALDFNGSDATAVSDGGMALDGAVLTLETWVYVDNFNDTDDDSGIAQIMGIEADGTQSAYLRFGDVLIDSSQLQFVLDIGGEVKLTSISTFNTGEWYHIAGTYDGSHMRIYINGEEDVSAIQTGNCSANSLFRLANSNGVRLLDGRLDEARVWKTARNLTQIRRAMYNQLATNDRASLHAYYQMNYGSGATLTDNSTNSNTITLTNQSIYKN